MTSINKRQRQTQSCDRCRIRKRKCDNGEPCQNCLKAGADCTRHAIQQKRGPKKFKGSKSAPASAVAKSNPSWTTPEALSVSSASSRQCLRVLKSKPVSYQEPSEDSPVDDYDEIRVYKSAKLRVSPPRVSPPQHPQEQQQLQLLQVPQCNTHLEQQQQASLISDFLASPFGPLHEEDSDKPHKKLLEMSSRPVIPDSAAQLSPKSVIFQGYDFNLLSSTNSPTTAIPPVPFPSDQFLPFHEPLMDSKPHPSVLSTDASLHALGTSLSALQGLPEDQLESLDPFDLFFEVPQSPQSLNSEKSSSLLPTHSQALTASIKESLPVSQKKREDGLLGSSIDPTWNENLLLGGGHVADYFAQIEDQYLL